MSLQTVIQIGKEIRKSDKGLAYHRYVRKAPVGNEKREFQYFQLDINNKMEIDFNSLKIIDDDNYISEKLFYLAYRTGEADTYVKYIFGDFCSDYFKLADATKKASSLYAKNSFDRGEVNAEQINSTVINTFRSSLSELLNQLLASLEPHSNWYINFNFEGKQWYELTETYELLNEAILSNFIKEENGKISLDAFLVRTLIGASSRLPDFNPKNTYKTKQFKSIEEVKDLLFGLDFYLKGYKIRDDDIMINMLPKGNMDPEDIIEFFKKENKELEFEADVEEEEKTDSTLVPALGFPIKGIEKYDIIFSKESKPIGLDLLEINDISKNLLQEVDLKIRRIKKEMRKQGMDTKFVNVRSSLKALFKGKKYKNHLLRVLPKIYQDTYYEDNLLLPTFLKRVEFLIRNPEKTSNKRKYTNGQKPYFILRNHFYFLIQLLKNNNLMAIKDSKSFRLGYLLGTMAEPLAAWRNNCPIKSFEKSYAGILSRRIATIPELSNFIAFLNEKLVMHKKNSIEIKNTYRDLIQILEKLEPQEYNKDYCELGFFKGYYPPPKETVAE